MTTQPRFDLTPAHYPQIAELYAKGKTAFQIAKTLSLSVADVRSSLTFLFDEWKNQAVDSIQEAINKELFRLSLVESEAWDEWEKSKRPTLKRRIEKMSPATDSSMTLEETFDPNESAVNRVILEENSASADPRFLTTVLNAIRQRVDILKLTDTSFNINFSKLSDAELNAIAAGRHPLDVVTHRDETLDVVASRDETLDAETKEKNDDSSAAT